MWVKFIEKLFLILILTVIAATGIPAVNALSGRASEYILQGNEIFGRIPIRVDALSAWMIIIINFTMLTGTLYGLKYLKPYRDKTTNYLIHLVMILVFHVSMLAVCIVQNFLAFLTVWELMAISSFMLVILEYWKKDTIRAGLNYLIQSHIGVIFLMIGFLWVIAQTGSYDFSAIRSFSIQLPMQMSLTLFVILFIGFGFKAGFIPFHTWLPYAHPAAPSHVSGMMSGVIIKLGIYGILRTLLLIKTDMTAIGWIILAVSAATGLYGVMLAIIQHNLKRLLAYHSIENIGIIGIGIGIGTIGIGKGNDFLAITGFAGGLLHILNHSLFKSLLFYTAGSIYQKAHTLNVEKLGGLVKRMPVTAGMFLLASMAICGLPPFNGFISEFLIYSGLFGGLKAGGFSFSISILISVIALVLIGGLAILCFTKAFGVVFLGTERYKFNEEPEEVPNGMLLPKFLAAALILFIGLFPGVMLQMLKMPVGLFVPSVHTSSGNIFLAQGEILNSVGLTGFVLLSFVLVIYLLKKLVTRNKTISEGPTWGCGYTAPTPRIQYTAGSFVKTYTNLVKPVLSIQKKDVNISEIFPGSQEYSTGAYDKAEHYLIDSVILFLRKLLSKFDFLQNGRLQFYILYGLFFMILIIFFSYGESIAGVVSGLLKMF